MKKPEIDFVAAPAWSRSVLLGLALLGLSISAVVFQLYRVHQQTLWHTTQTQRLSEKLREQTPQAVVLDPEAARALAEKDQALQKVRGTLAQNLRPLTQLEDCVAEDFVFLRIKPGLAEQPTALTVETRDIEALNRGLLCLEAAGGFKRVQLITQQRIADDPQHPLRLELLGE